MSGRVWGALSRGEAVWMLGVGVWVSVCLAVGDRLGDVGPHIGPRGQTTILRARVLQYREDREPGAPVAGFLMY